MTLNDFKPPDEVFWCFCDIRLRCTLQWWIATNWLHVDQDNMRTRTAKAVARLMSLVRITCFMFSFYDSIIFSFSKPIFFS